MYISIIIWWHAVFHFLNCAIMKGGYMRRIVILFIGICFPLLASADLLRLAAGLTVEPYISEFSDSGFEVDIVREAFALEGYQVQFI